MKKLLALFPILLVAACGDTRVEFAKPPVDKLVCDPEPGRPAGNGERYTDARGIERNRITDADTADYLKELRGTGQSCRDDVEWLRDWFASLAK